MANDTLYILDSYALIYRSYFAFVNRPLVNEKGENVSAVFGFFRNFYNILQKHKPEYVVAAFDPRGPTFRHEMYDKYKATRDKTPEDLHSQIPIIENILGALGIPVVVRSGFEADDVIATLAERCAKEKRGCRILSSDKDLMQLINDTTFMMKPDKAGGWEVIDSEGVEKEWSVPPNLMLDLLSLTGDTADNIPGVLGIGGKTAAKLLLQYGSLENIYANADEVAGAMGQKLRDGKESAWFSRSLIELRKDVPIDEGFEQYHIVPDYNAAALILSKQGVPAVAKQFATAGGGSVVIDGDTAGATTERITSATINGTVSSTGNLPRAAVNEAEFTEVRKNSGDYSLIRTMAELTSFVDAILHAKCAAFDCETDSLNTHTTRLAGFSFCMEVGKAVYVPIETTDMLLAGDMVSKADALSQLERLFFKPDIALIMHNGKFDLEVLYSNGLGGTGKDKKFPTCAVYDTMIAAWLLQPDRDSLKLESLAERKLGLQGIEFSAIVPKGSTFLDVPLEQAADYAAEDADFTLQLWNFFKPLLDESGLASLFYDLETPILPILAQMEIEGIRIESQKLADYSKELEKEIGVTEKDIYELVGHEFNIASTKQLQEVLFVERKLTPSKKTKTGYSTDTSVLQELAAYDPVPRKILDYRTMAKLKSTYVDALPILADAKGRIHTSFVQTGTATGRLSSREPNLQNIPVREEAGRRIRAAFIAPKGRTLVSADYSQIELVILAHLSGDKNLCAAFNEGTDVHRATAALIFGVEVADVTADQRRTAKTINFGVMYGMSAFRLSNELGIPRSTAKQFIDSYFATYSGIQSFMHTTIENAEQTGYVETIMGRRRYIQAIASKNKMEKAGAERMAINTPIQGSAADIVKKAMLAVHKALTQEIPTARLLLQVHDELIAECDEKDAPAVAELFKREMEAAIQLSIPLRVSVEHAASWGDFH